MEMMAQRSLKQDAISYSVAMSACERSGQWQCTLELEFLEGMAQQLLRRLLRGWRRHVSAERQLASGRANEYAAEVLWRTETSSGWSITFQPDYTSPSCQGQWCPQFRGTVDLSTLKLR